MILSPAKDRDRTGREDKVGRRGKVGIKGGTVLLSVGNCKFQIAK
jgi:hypothetical protein